MRIRTKIAASIVPVAVAAAIVATVATRSTPPAATAHATAPTTPAATAPAIPGQREASEHAAQVTAKDARARAAFEARWATVNFDDTAGIGAELTALAKFANGLDCTPKLHSAMMRLVGDTVAFYFATAHRPTQAQIAADAEAVNTP